MRAGHEEWNRSGPDGEIGRRSGLKIRGPETAVGVQVSLRAPENPLTTLLIELAFFRALQSSQSTMGIFPYLKKMQRAPLSSGTPCLHELRIEVYLNKLLSQS
jgi:hypothetical protein